VAYWLKAPPVLMESMLDCGGHSLSSVYCLSETVVSAVGAWLRSLIGLGSLKVNRPVAFACCASETRKGMVRSRQISMTKIPGYFDSVSGRIREARNSDPIGLRTRDQPRTSRVACLALTNHHLIRKRRILQDSCAQGARTHHAEHPFTGQVSPKSRSRAGTLLR
jgi:hypothetical protein